jgi:16S rRNA (guanine(966)-N(2))-methyltransferase RsmD
VKTQRAGAVPHEVRIIGGQWRRSRLPVADRPGLRPTPSRLRETLYNWLGQDLTGWRCIDAFAGSGALGFEAASRGAAEVRMFEADRVLARSLAATAQRLGAAQVRIEAGDALAGMARCAPASFDLVLLDPPFADTALLAAALAAAARVVAPGGWVYAESAAPPDAAATASLGLAPWRSTHAGAVHGALLRREAGGGG